MSRVRSKLSAVSRDVRPFRPPRPVRVIVDGRQAKTAAPYVRFLGVPASLRRMIISPLVTN